MPTLSLSLGSGAGENESLGSNSFIIGSGGEANITLKQVMPDSQTVPAGLTDNTFTILLNSRFLELDNTADFIDEQPDTRIATFTKQGTVDTNSASTLSLVVKRNTLSSTVFTQFGDPGNPNQITSVVSIIGDQSGLRKDIKVTVES